MTIYNNDLHPDFARSLDRLSGEGSLVLVIRHSTRGPIPPAGRGDKVPLTQEGIDLSERLGSKLSNRCFDSIFSSTIPRCVETAEALCRGAGQAVRIQQRRQLARPEPQGESQLLKLSNKIVEDPVRLVNHLLQCHRGNGYRALPPAVTEIQHCVSEPYADRPDRETIQRGRLRLIVTHDDVIAFALAVLLGRETVTFEDLPWMLEGFFLCKRGGRDSVLWRGRALPIREERFTLSS